MPIPNSLFDLVEVHTASGGQYPVPGWENDFGPYAFCYASGLKDVATKFGFTKADQIAKARYRDQALAAVPPQWKTDFPEGDFAQFDTGQLRKAYRRKPGRLDKVAISIVMFHFAVENSVASLHADDVKGKSVFDLVLIRPAIFVPNDPKNDCLKISDTACTAIRQKTHQFCQSPIRRIGGYIGLQAERENRGKPVTFIVASEVAQHLNTDVLQIDRGEIPAPKRPNNGELV